MSRYVNIDQIIADIYEKWGCDPAYYVGVSGADAHQAKLDADLVEFLQSKPYINIVTCRECKHRPKKPYPGASRFNLQFPDGACPYYCDDGYYCEYPSDDFFCANGEREEKANE